MMKSEMNWKDRLRRPKGTKSTERKLIARFTTAELAEIVEGEHAVQHLYRTYNLALRGQHTVWLALAKKYGLPSLVDFDRQTGEVFEKPIQGAEGQVKQA